MTSLSERLDTDGKAPQLQEPDDWDRPSPRYAPFELKDASGLSQNLGSFLTSPFDAGDDANPDIVLEHSNNQEVTVWIARFGSDDGLAYILTCWDHNHRMHFEISRETAVDVIEQASDSAYWKMDIDNDELRGTLLKSL